ncbi:MAG: YbaY family lipoprotein [Rudaea sp.]
MRILLFSTLSALGLLAGCAKEAPPPVAPTLQISNEVSGTIILREPGSLGNDARVELKVVDVANPTTPLAQTVIEHANKLPISFSMPIDVSQVNPTRTYAVDAMLIDGERRYLPVLQYPVLTNRAPATVQIVLAPEATPAEKMFEAYKAAFAQIGSLKSVNGSELKDKSSVAWDAFYSNGKIRVVREISDLDDNQGRITMRIAFKEDKPWVIVKQEATSESTRPFATTKVGWDESGTLVLKEKEANGQTSVVPDADAKALYAHAMQALDAAKAKLPKH